jgi:hypothetical protein
MQKMLTCKRCHCSCFRTSEEKTSDQSDLFNYIDKREYKPNCMYRPSQEVFTLCSKIDNFMDKNIMSIVGHQGDINILESVVQRFSQQSCHNIKNLIIRKLVKLRINMFTREYGVGKTAIYGSKSAAGVELK